MTTDDQNQSMRLESTNLAIAKERGWKYLFIRNSPKFNETKMNLCFKGKCSPFWKKKNAFHKECSSLSKKNLISTIVFQRLSKQFVAKGTYKFL